MGEGTGSLAAWVEGELTEKILKKKRKKNGAACEWERKEERLLEA